jgi:tetratricopeptide (TPR) repeat protein
MSFSGSHHLIAIVSVLAFAELARSQAPSNLPPPPSLQSISLPKTCQGHGRGSEKIAALLEIIRNHPTPGAFNTLGALYAQQGFSSCAVAAFEAALRLDSRNWEAHYNLGIARMHSGDRAHAKNELRAAIQEKPDSAISHYALGTVLQEEHKLVDAEGEFRTALSIDSHMSLASISLAQVQAAQGRHADAIVTLQQAASLSPPGDQAELLRSALGLTYAQSGDVVTGTESLRKVVVDYPDSADAHFQLGTLYAQQDKADLAIAEYHTALRLDRTANGVRLALARALLSQQKYSDALKTAQENVRQDPQSAEGYHLEGLAYKGLQQLQHAAAALERAERMAPADYEIRHDLGLIFMQLGRADDAVHEFEAAARINSEEPDPHHQLAQLYEKKGDKYLARRQQTRYEFLVHKEQAQSKAGRLNSQGNQLLNAGDARAAAEAYRKALDLIPGDPQLHYNLALALNRLGDQKGENQELKRAVQLKPDLAVAHNQLGLLAMQAGEQFAAEQEFKAALTINPKYAEALSNLGVLYTQLGKDSDAANLFQQANESDPSYSQAYVNLGLLLARQGEFSEAEKQLQSAVQADPNNAGARTALGMVQTKTGRSADAVATFRKVVELQPNSSDAHLNLGIALIDQYDRVAGLREFTEAVRLNPNSPAAHSSLGHFYFETEKYEDARRELETACRLQSDNAGALYFLALTERQTNNVQRAADLLQKLVALEPNHSEAQFLLGQNLEKLGKTNEAIDHWKQAIEANPNDSQALYNLARTLNRLHDPRAQEYQDRFDALQKRKQLRDRVAQLGNLALEAANAENWPQVMEYMAEAIQLCGGCAESAHLHKNLGLFYGRTGNIGEAEKELQTALQLTPNDADVENALSQLERAQQAQAK